MKDTIYMIQILGFINLETLAFCHTFFILNKCHFFICLLGTQHNQLVNLFVNSSSVCLVRWAKTFDIQKS